MPQLVKGGKWVFGWAVVGSKGEIQIPGKAWSEYGFEVGDEALFLPGSRRSGGFGISTPELLKSSGPLIGSVMAQSRFDVGGQVVVPPEVGAVPGAQLLAVRGSGLALGFVAQGPIFEEALKQSDRLQVFEAQVLEE